MGKLTRDRPSWTGSSTECKVGCLHLLHDCSIDIARHKQVTNTVALKSHGHSLVWVYTEKELELDTTKRDLPSKAKLVGNSDEFLGGNRNGANMPTRFPNPPNSVQVHYNTPCVSIFVLCKQCFLAALKTEGWRAAPISCSLRSGFHQEIRQNFQQASPH